MAVLISYNINMLVISCLVGSVIINIIILQINPSVVNIVPATFKFLPNLSLFYVSTTMPTPCGVVCILDTLYTFNMIRYKVYIIKYSSLFHLTKESFTVISEIEVHHDV